MKLLFYFTKDDLVFSSSNMYNLMILTSLLFLNYYISLLFSIIFITIFLICVKLFFILYFKLNLSNFIQYTNYLFILCRLFDIATIL